MLNTLWLQPFALGQYSTFLPITLLENIISNAVLLAFATVYALALLLSLTAQQVFKLHAAKYILPAGFLSFFCFGLWIDLFEKIFRTGEIYCRLFIDMHFTAVCTFERSYIESRFLQLSQTYCTCRLSNPLFALFR